MDEENYIIPQTNTVVSTHLSLRCLVTAANSSSRCMLRPRYLHRAAAGDLSGLSLHLAICKRTHGVPQVLGGTAQRGDTDLAPREEDREHIWKGCLKMAPSLAAAKVLYFST